MCVSGARIHFSGKIESLRAVGSLPDWLHSASSAVPW